MADPHRSAQVYQGGAPLTSATGAMILLHGRGASAEDILYLGSELAQLHAHDARTSGLALLAPQAAGHTWYPNSFLAPIAQNEPYLSSAIQLVSSIVEQVIEAGIPSERIVLAGFSQGACLSTEFVARHPRRYAALLAFTGGLIGPPGLPLTGASLAQTDSLDGMPALFSSGDPDPHVPWQRIEESAVILRAMGAEVETRRYPGRPHTILAEELETARSLLRVAL